MSDTYRLVTRSDFDGLVCAVLLKERGMLNDIKFVHPKDMQDGKVEVGPRDITTNLPYVAGVHLAFDHHLSETLRVKDRPQNHIIDADAPSTRPTPPASASRRSSTPRGGCSSTTSWIRAPASGASATSASRTTS